MKRNILKRVFNKKTITSAISFSIAGLFLYTAISKLRIHKDFVEQLTKSPFTKAFPQTLSYTIPALEILIAAMLIYYKSRKIGLYSSFVLTSLFTVYIIQLLRYGYYVNCSCGGVVSKLSWMQHLYFNAGLLLLAGIGVWLFSPRPARTNPGI